MPQSREDMRAYADLIRSDFESYIADVQHYFRCLDTERARAFVEAREVSEDYARFLNAVE
ncbi:hypothetical protein ACSQ8I_24125 [Marinovum sp. E06]|uniref:hypothetical protein n=1 Tax=unclassified Marinovum TaxID=2647166 RepID=UPI003EDC5D2E